MIKSTKKTIALLCALVFLCVSLMQAVIPVLGEDDSGGAPVLTEESQHPNTHSGNWALRMDLSGVDWKSFSTMINVTQDTQYVLQFWLKGSGTVHGVVKNSSWEGISYENFAATDTWTQCSLSFNSGSNTLMPLQFVDVDSSGIVYIDDITLKAEGQDPQLIPNGDFEQGPGAGGYWCEDGCIAAIVEPATFVESSDINPKNAEYNLLGENKSDLVISVIYNGNELVAIRNGDTELEADSDYILSGDSVTIKKEYLDTLSEGVNVLTFDFDKGDDPTLSINVSAYNRGIVDELSDFSKMYDYHNISTVSPNDVLGSDADRVFPSQWDEQAYFIYESDEDITSFVSGVWYWAQRPIQDIIVSVSTTADGIYIPVELNKVTKAEENDWPYVTYSCFDMPIENARYLKVELPILPDTNNWAIQVGVVLINSCVSPVEANPGTGKIDGATMVELSTQTEGATIFYYTDQDSTHKLYEGPIEIISYTTIYAYAKKTGLKDSFISEFTYYTAAEELVDTYGQLKNADFDTKVRSDDELRADVAADEEYYGSLNPPERDIYGGELGSREEYDLEATGFFNIQKIGDKFVMADPLGNLFFSLGVCCTGSAGESYTQITGREHIYEWLPDPEGEFATAFLNGNPNYFSHYVANQIKKYGEPFDKVDYYKRSIERLRKWGFTSEGGFAETPPVHLNDTGFPEIRFEYFPDGYSIGGTTLYDIYKEGAVEALRDWFIEKGVAERKDDPNILGYMFGNELPYHQFINLILRAKASEVATKGALVDFLEGKYEDIESFNSAWEVEYSSFDELREASLLRNTEAAANDMIDFFKVYLDEFYSSIATQFRELDPNHMLMSDRYLVNVADNTDIRNALCEVGGKYFDVICYNYYTYSPNLSRIESMAKLANKPIIITEFHYGEPTQGMNAAMRMVENEEEKGLCYRNYVENLAASGYVVGCHWFEWMDQSVTGRWFEGLNGEAFAIGLINVADRPYKTMLESVMETNYNIYDIITGEREAFVFDKYALRENVPIKDTNIPKVKDDVTIVIDGVKDDEWPDGDILSVDDSNRSLGVKKEGVSAEFSLAWDDTYLYIFADVNDPTPMQNSKTGFDIYDGDAIELFIGPSKINDPGTLKIDDSQIIINAETGESYWYNHNVNTQPEIETEIRMKEDQSGYTLEAAIKLSDLAVSDAAQDRVIRFDIGFDNGEGGRRVAQYLWSGIDGNASNRDKWGTATFTEESEEPGDDPGTGTPSTPGGTQPADNKVDTSGTATIKAQPDLIDGVATVNVSQNDIEKELAEAVTDANGIKSVDIMIEGTEGTKAYSIGLPSAFLTAAKKNAEINIVTSVGNITLPNNMLSEEILDGADEIQLTINLIEPDEISDPELKSIVGNRPVIDISILADGKEIAWENPNGAVLVSIPYTPSAEELENPDFINVLYIDSQGRVHSVPNGRYDFETGMVTFEITHFSRYAVSYSHKELVDFEMFTWAKLPAEVLVSKGILEEVSEGKFDPMESITRAEFVAGLVRSLGLSASIDSNFVDVNETDPYYNEIGIAKALGITVGIGGDRFGPDIFIARQDMMVMMAKALTVKGLITSIGKTSDLDKFIDKDQISDYAKLYVAILVKNGYIYGDGTRISPKDYLNRASAASALYNIIKSN